MIIFVSLSSFCAGALVLFFCEAMGIAALSKQWIESDYID
jgi:hypothetical protein